jgi:hypothetical protein
MMDTVARLRVDGIEPSSRTTLGVSGERDKTGSGSRREPLGDSRTLDSLRESRRASNIRPT